MHAIIHIGTAKTGTTSIQRFLSDSRALLQEQGYLYPGSLSAGDPTAHGYAHNQLARKLLCGQGGEMLAPLQAELKACGAKGIIISAEMLSHFMDTPAQVRTLQDLLQHLGCDDITIVVWLREQGAMFSSLCSQDLRNGVMGWSHLTLPGNNERFRISMDYRELLQRWAGVFGRQALTVRLFERECFVQGNLLHDAVDAFGLEWNERFAPPPRENESLNLLEMEILRVLNHQLPGHTGFIGTPKFDLCKLLARHLGALNGPQLRFAPPRQIVQAWREWAAEGNEWVRQEFFPERQTLFAPPREQEENYELTQLTPGCWEALGRALAELSEENFLLRRELQRLRSQTGSGAVPSDRSRQAR